MTYDAAAYHRAWREANREKTREYQRRYIEKHPERRRESVNKHNATDAFRARINAWRKANPGKCNEVTARRHARKRNAMPKWLTPDDRAYIKAVYMAASELGHHVDHFVPLTHPLVCGLHVPWNLQIITPDANRKKGNRFEVG